MGRKAKAAAEQPNVIVRAEVRLYAWEPELAEYFRQFAPRQYAAAIKRAVRAALSGGGLGLGAKLALPVADDADDDDFFSAFVS